MTAKPKFKSDAFEAIHSSAQALFKVGGINKTTLRNFDASCLVVVDAIGPEQIKKIRELSLGRQFCPRHKDPVFDIAFQFCSQAAIQRFVTFVYFRLP